MDDHAAAQILALLGEGREAEARTLFMKQLVAHCRDIDRVISEFFSQARYDDAHLWEVFALASRQAWFGMKQ
jgi:hypothetical protein